MKEKRFIIRDIKTKKPYFLNRKKMDFTSENAAIEYLRSMNFNLNIYYEIYDKRREVVI